MTVVSQGKQAYVEWGLAHVLLEKGKDSKGKTGNLHNMRKKMWHFRRLLLFSVLGFVYFSVLLRGLNEGSRRSLQLRDDAGATDHIVISVLVTGVNPATQELTAQISLRPQGALAQDEVTPAVDLKLLTNNVRSQEQFDFPKGKRMNRIEAVFPLNGELNKYPFDRYGTTLWLLITTPAREAQPKSYEDSGRHRTTSASARATRSRRNRLATEHSRPAYGQFVCIDSRNQIRG